MVIRVLNVKNLVEKFKGILENADLIPELLDLFFFSYLQTCAHCLSMILVGDILDFTKMRTDCVFEVRKSSTEQETNPVKVSRQREVKEPKRSRTYQHRMH